MSTPQNPHTSNRCSSCRALQAQTRRCRTSRSPILAEPGTPRSDVRSSNAERATTTAAVPARPFELSQSTTRSPTAAAPVSPPASLDSPPLEPITIVDLEVSKKNVAATQLGSRSEAAARVPQRGAGGRIFSADKASGTVNAKIGFMLRANDVHEYLDLACSRKKNPVKQEVPALSEVRILGIECLRDIQLAIANPNPRPLQHERAPQGALDQCPVPRACCVPRYVQAADRPSRARSLPCRAPLATPRMSRPVLPRVLLELARRPRRSDLTPMLPLSSLTRLGWSPSIWSPGSTGRRAPVNKRALALVRVAFQRPFHQRIATGGKEKPCVGSNWERKCVVEQFSTGFLAATHVLKASRPWSGDCEPSTSRNIIGRDIKDRALRPLLCEMEERGGGLGHGDHDRNSHPGDADGKFEKVGQREMKVPPLHHGNKVHGEGGGRYPKDLRIKEEGGTGSSGRDGVLIKQVDDYKTPLLLPPAPSPKRKVHHSWPKPLWTKLFAALPSNLFFEASGQDERRERASLKCSQRCENNSRAKQTLHDGLLRDDTKKLAGGLSWTAPAQAYSSEKGTAPQTRLCGVGGLNR
ncbi:hypothetical protein BDK51DRAFT_43683 [Blyttiomyces helicus]|uniref:Uncharacterized protein n=1 Tax=Blyttiomyces helicus TaxID=388810 RepID=A0A4P9WFB3_9FUNG|nr:hypothetical protein BDK51DRAFT_43683 [Blyttiomyces helicus]|eukprot:RKO91421.1 hypothetical protein BDK51DRAFT_43683 [Blyttiomyces helicus]